MNNVDGIVPGLSDRFDFLVYSNIECYFELTKKRAFEREYVPNL